ncbi:MAG: hypothetical protein HQ465_13425, partial [Rhodospirillales bacterium]|nr:hypothetical protein [Rhodospirillales bacterium]
MIRSLAFNTYFYVGTLLVAVVGILLVPIPTPVLLRGLLFHWARGVLWGMRWIGGMKIEFRGLEYLPTSGPVLLVRIPVKADRHSIRRRTVIPVDRGQRSGEGGHLLPSTVSWD